MNLKKIKTALVHKIRSTEREFKNEEKVYFKRENLKQGNRNKWSGPATVIGKHNNVKKDVVDGVLKIRHCMECRQVADILIKSGVSLDQIRKVKTEAARCKNISMEAVWYGL